MKKLVLVFSCLSLLLTSQDSFGQKGEQDISLSYGFLSTPILASYLGQVVADVLTGSETHLNALGPIMVGYSYHMGERVTVGLTASYTQASIRVRENDKLYSRNSYYSFMPQATVFLGNKDKVEAYAGLALGAALYAYSSSSFDRNTLQFAYQVTPIGVRTAGETGVFIELGYGYKGLLNIGVSRRL